MGFFEEIGRNFGHPTVNLLKKMCRLNTKLAKLKNRLTFLIKCRRNGLFPPHIGNCSKNWINLLETDSSILLRRLESLKDRWAVSTLNLEIKITIDNLSKIKVSFNNLSNRIKALLPSNVYNNFVDSLKFKYNKIFCNVRKSNIKKFKMMLTRSKNNVKFFNDNKKWLVNLTSVDVPEEVVNLLSLGPKFNLPVDAHNFDLKRLLMYLENIINELKTDTKNVVRGKITNIITNYMGTGRTCDGLHSILRNYLKKTKIFLKDNPSVMITKADKGSTTVIIDKTDYINKSKGMLDDINVYKVLNSNPLLTVQNNINSFIKLLQEKNYITFSEKKKLTTNNSILAKAYFLPKIHKEGVPLRPIISSIGAASYDLSGHISDILSRTFSNRTNYNITNTFQFVEEFRGYSLPENHILISLDVVSLFTVIPLDLVNEIIKEKWNLIAEHCSWDRDTFLTGLKLIFDTSIFTFDNVIYHQVEGTPMGSKISPVLALIVMDYALDEILINNGSVFRINFIKKYVDDLVLGVHKDDVNTVLNCFNDFHPSIQFTMELESNNSIPFLDTKIIRDGFNKIKFDWYVKPTYSGRYLNYFSSHSFKHKLSTVRCMKHRVSNICDKEFLRENLEFLQKTFVNNGYPSKLINKILFSTPLINNNINQVSLTNPSLLTTEPIIYKKLPYIEKLSDSLKKTLSVIDNLKVVECYDNKLGNHFTKLKDATENKFKSNLIYCISCNDCSGKYVGQTSQWLKSRISKHKSNCRLNKTVCALSQHVQDCKHTFDFDNVKILDVESNYYNRIFLEMVHINYTSNTVNYRTDTQNLSNIYAYLFTRDKTNHNYNPPTQHNHDINNVSTFSNDMVF